MGKALLCNRCKTDRWLHFQSMAPVGGARVYRVRCDECGHTGSWEKTRAEAGEAWNTLMKSKQEESNE